MSINYVGVLRPASLTRWWWGGDPGNKVVLGFVKSLTNTCRYPLVSGTL